MKKTIAAITALLLLTGCSFQRDKFGLELSFDAGDFQYIANTRVYDLAPAAVRSYCASIHGTFVTSGPACVRLSRDLVVPQPRDWCVMVFPLTAVGDKRKALRDYMQAVCNGWHPALKS